MYFLTFIMIALVAMPAFAEPPTSFEHAKNTAQKLWWEIGPSSFYCRCPYRKATKEEKLIRKGNLWVIGFACGYKAKRLVTKKGKPNARALRIEWEHIVPAEWIASGFNCKDLTRKECRKVDGYKKAEGDLFNLVPAIGELNGDRIDKLHGVIPKEERKYGACDFEVSNTKAEPMESIRGDIARVWLYMLEKYHLKLSDDFIDLMKQWDKDDPVDTNEKLRHDMISCEMGWKNPYVVK